jgi:hypothetical protein
MAAAGTTTDLPLKAFTLGLRGPVPRSERRSSPTLADLLAAQQQPVVDYCEDGDPADSGTVEVVMSCDGKIHIGGVPDAELVHRKNCIERTQHIDVPLLNSTFIVVNGARYDSKALSVPSTLPKDTPFMRWTLVKSEDDARLCVVRMCFGYGVHMQKILSRPRTHVRLNDRDGCAIPAVHVDPLPALSAVLGRAVRAIASPVGSAARKAASILPSLRFTCILSNELVDDRRYYYNPCATLEQADALAHVAAQPQAHTPVPAQPSTHPAAGSRRKGLYRQSGRRH